MADGVVELDSLEIRPLGAGVGGSLDVEGGEVARFAKVGKVDVKASCEDCEVDWDT